MRRARTSGERYSRVIGWLKLVLPLSALALLSMVFLLASPVDPRRAIETAEIDVEDRARDPRVSGARFAGVTDDGAALRIEAETARTDPDAMLRFDVSGLSLHLDGPQGESVLAQADAGAIDRGQGVFSMDGGVQVTASPGYSLSTRRISGMLDITRIEVEGPLSGTAPVGEIHAGHLLISAKEGGDEGYSLVFGDGVRLIYQP
ncbi:MAG: lipopolysaccharide export system permease component LptC [Rhodobacteraceae bacterium HLUCCA12]|nr:MAG: lipopolysaccharide export system permease component LptC [Rhodobacteraceae bacterium HLUCCA12]